MDKKNKKLIIISAVSFSILIVMIVFTIFYRIRYEHILSCISFLGGACDCICESNESVENIYKSFVIIGHILLFASFIYNLVIAFNKKLSLEARLISRILTVIYTVMIIIIALNVINYL